MHIKDFSKALLVSTFLLSSLAEAGSWTHGAELDVSIISDNGYELTQYPTKQRSNTYRAYIEAQDSQEYAIQVRNHSAHRIGVVVAVDGRNIISGKKSRLRASERMYILEPYGQNTYRGWRTAKDQVNRFFFTDAGASYSAAWGDYSAMGVIAVAAFREHYPNYPRFEKKRQSRANDSARSPGRAMEPGTGFGQAEWSPSQRVYFKPERRAFTRTFLKYEWRHTLCQKGVINCHKPTHRPRHNRFWDDNERVSDYAPFPRYQN